MVALLAVALLGAAPASAQSAQVSVAQFGWRTDGTLRRGWNPVIVRVSGANEAAARVQVTLKISVGSANQTFITPVATYAQDVALPSGTTRDVKLWLPVPSDGAYLVTAQLLNSGGQVLAEQSTSTPLTARADGAPLIATLAASPSVAAQLTQIEVPYQRGLTAQVRSVELSPADVPSQPDYLAGFHGMVVEGDAAATLTAEQKRAIQQWVGLGGHLLVVGGPGASRAAAVLDGADALGLRFGQLSSTADLQPLAVWVGGDPAGHPTSGPAAQIQSTGAQLLAGAPDRALAARASWGDGSVTLLGVDPSLEPLRGWSGASGLLARALQPALSSASANAADASRLGLGSQTRQDDMRLVSAIDSLPTIAVPDWKQIALLLGGFAFCVGPLLHFVLWRTGRRTWLWIAVPALSVAFTAAIYLSTVVQPGHDVVANVVSEVRFDPNTGDARQAMAVAFFAPLHEQLSVRIGGEVPVRVASGRSSSGGLPPGAALTLGLGGSRSGARLPGYRVITGRETQVEYTSDASIDDGLRSMVLSRGLPHGSIGQIEANLHIEGSDGIVEGTVRNSTAYTFEQVGLLVGQSVSRLGTLAPGQTAPVSFDPRATAPAAPGTLAYSFAWQLFGIQGPARLNLPSDPEVRRHLKIVDAVFSSTDRYGSISYGTNGLPNSQASTNRPMLVGITSDPVGGDVLPSAGSQRVYQATVVEVPVHLTIAPGPFTVAPVLMPPTVGVESGGSLNPSSSSSSTGSQAWLDLRGTATYTFRVDLPRNSHVERLNVTTQQPSGGPGAPAAFSAYNWQAATWRSLSAGGRDVALDPAEDYIGPDGSLRIQVTSGGTDRTVRFLAPELTLQGEAGS